MILSRNLATEFLGSSKQRTNRPSHEFVVQFDPSLTLTGTNRPSHAGQPNPAHETQADETATGAVPDAGGTVHLPMPFGDEVCWRSGLAVACSGNSLGALPLLGFWIAPRQVAFSLSGSLSVPCAASSQVPACETGPVHIVHDQYRIVARIVTSIVIRLRLLPSFPTGLKLCT